MDVVRTWTGHLVRRGWRATIALVVLAGIAAGVAMAAWSAGRRTATAFDRFRQYADAPELIVTFCPPDLVEVDQDSLVRCMVYDPAEEVALLRDLPEVEAAARASFLGLTFARPDEPERTRFAIALIMADPGMPSVEGDQILVAGRWSSPNAADEVMVNEWFIEQSGVAVGDEVLLTFWAPDELGKATRDRDRLHGPTVRVRVVGVVRGLLDLAAGADVIGEAEVIAGPGLAPVIGGTGRFGGIVIRARDGDGEAAAAAIDRAFPGRLLNVSSAVGTDELEPIREAISYEARGALAFGAVTALAATMFVGQAVARQSRREWAELDTLRVLGISDHDVRWSAGLRGAMVGGGAALVAGVVAIALSPIGPVGVARRAETDPGPRADLVVLGVGMLGLLAVVMVATWLPLRRYPTSSSAPRSMRRRRGVRGPFRPEAVAGLRMIVRSGRDGRSLPIGTALTGVAFAVAAVVAAGSLTASLDALTGSPDRFGASWDVTVSGVGGDDPDALMAAVLAGEPAVDAASGIVGAEVEIGNTIVWVQAFRPVGDLDGIRPVITAGREPFRSDEIALGSITMRDLGLTIGDTVDLRSTVAGRRPSTMVVVGTTIVNDSFESSPGRGGVVTSEWLEAIAPELSPDPFVVRLAPDADVQAFGTSLEDRPTGLVSPPTRQGAIRNIERIAALPFLLAAVIALLAAASLAHALTLTIRRSRFEFAVWKSIGFTRGQVRTAVAYHASGIALGAAAVAVPLGVILGRVGWRVVADQLGVASGPVTSVIAIVFAVLGAILVANMIAAYPAWRAARQPIGEALRAE